MQKIINNLNFIVLSPWRAGSILCACLLSEYVRVQTGNRSLYYLSGFNTSDWQCDDPTKLINEWKENSVYHTHNCNNLNNIPDNFNVIIPNRSVFDCAISNIIANKLDKFSYFHQENLNIELKPFVIDKYELATQIITLNSVRFAINKKAATIPNPVITVEYVDYKDHNQRLFDILGIDFKLTNTKLIPVKVPLDYKSVILNYHELEKKFRI